jgi:hypothetical protein
MLFWSSGTYSTSWGASGVGPGQNVSPLALLSPCAVGRFMSIFALTCRRKAHRLGRVDAGTYGLRGVNEAAQRDGGEGRQSAQRQATAAETFSRGRNALSMYQAYCALLPALFVQVT